MGLREQKKAKTRKMISDLATQLFIEQGFDKVTVAEIAKRAEVSVPTLFNYFPNKESMVFDEDEKREIRLIAAVSERKKDQSILDALQEHFLGTQAMRPENIPQITAFNKLIESSPELVNYSRQMWLRYEQSLANQILKENSKKMSRLEAEAVSHFILDAFLRASRAADPKAAIKALFKLLKEGWA